MMNFDGIQVVQMCIDCHLVPGPDSAPRYHKGEESLKILHCDLQFMFLIKKMNHLY